MLGATLAVSYRAGWLVSAAVAALVLGLAFYVFTAARFDLRDLVTGYGHAEHEPATNTRQPRAPHTNSGSTPANRPGHAKSHQADTKRIRHNSSYNHARTRPRTSDPNVNMVPTKT